MMEKAVNYLLLIFIFFNLQACHAQQKEPQMPSQPSVYTLSFGLEGEKQFEKYMTDSVDQQPAGMSFFTLNWTPPQLAKVKIDFGKDNLEIAHVLSVMGTRIDYSKKNEGIQIMDIDAGLNQEEFVTSKDAYLAYTELLNQLKQKGWVRYFSPDSPRIDIRDNLKYINKKDGDVVDPYQLLTFEQWEKHFNSSGSLFYKIYNHGTLIEFSINKTNEKDSKEQYIVRFAIQSIRYVELNLLDNGYQLEGDRLKEKFKSNRLEDQKQRNRLEKDSEKEGYHIDQSYQDPDVWNYVKSN